MSALPSYNKPLPQCDGPKLAPLARKRNAKVEFIRLLSDLKAEGHAHVFEVLIDSEEFALKVVRSHPKLRYEDCNSFEVEMVEVDARAIVQIL